MSPGVKRETTVLSAGFAPQIPETAEIHAAHKMPAPVLTWSQYVHPPV